ncbi:MAG: hypothetical protein JSR86_05150 [Proteobacteria bacterium]|nr:hypothetical protein [Pseudomonadota bacterium]
MPARLTRERFEAARAFMADRATPLDFALWRRAFEGGDGEAVIAALTPFQNPDGGFGHGLEPDLATPASSAIATSVGLRHLVRAGAAAGHPMVVRAMGWLAANIQDGVWPIVDAHVEDAPHAPWWGFDADLPARWLGFCFNPTAEILAWTYALADAAPAGMLAEAEGRMRRTIAEIDIITGAYDLRCAALLAEAPQAPADLRAGLTDLLLRSVAAHDPTDEHAPVLDLAPTPASLLAGPLAGHIDAAVAELIAGQQADGGWAPPEGWNWAFIDAAAANHATQVWRGTLTRLAVEALAAHGRIEGGARA